MKKLQFYKYAAIGLLVLNLSMLALFFLTKPPHPHRKGKNSHTRPVEILQLNEQQRTAFSVSAKAHHQQMKTIGKQQQDFLRPYLYSILDDSKNIDLGTTLLQFQALERQKIEATYQHFEEIKLILTPEQQNNFEAFVQHVVEHILFKTQRKKGKKGH